MKRKDLEIYLSQNVKSFSSPKVGYEQYQTPVRVAANLIFRAHDLGDIRDKKIIDICSGTGILAIGANLMGGITSAIEIDEIAFSELTENVKSMKLNIEMINSDALNYDFKSKYDTAILNPPFGIQQKKYRDLKFIILAHQISRVAYSIVDGSNKNKENLPDLLLKNQIHITEQYFDEFPLTSTFPWHQLKRKIHRVLILRTEKTN